MNERSFVTTLNDTLERAMLEDTEYLDGKLLVAAQGKCSRVHDLQMPGNDFIKGDVRVTRGVGIFLGIG